MPSRSETRILPYPADLMYAIVSDVERYPEFLPWVTDLKVIRRISDQVFDSEMSVGFAGLTERYTSRATLDPHARTIDVAQVDGGLFRQLENHWRFTPRDDGKCNVAFSIAFEFRSPLLNIVAGAAFERVMIQMADAFEARAKELSERNRA